MSYRVADKLYEYYDVSSKIVSFQCLTLESSLCAISLKTTFTFVVRAQSKFLDPSVTHWDDRRRGADDERGTDDKRGIRHDKVHWA